MLDKMIPKLLTYEKLHEKLSKTEPLQQITLDMDGTVQFSLPAGWNVGLKEADGTHVTDASMHFPNHPDDEPVKMTKDAVLQLASSIGLPRDYVMKTPGPMVESHINYWAKSLPSEQRKFLGTADGSVMLASMKPSITPFSNVVLLEAAHAKLKEKFGSTPIYADYKFHHDLRRTAYRLIVPEPRNIDTYRGGNAVTDQWSEGFQVINSLTGAVPTSLSGYLFAWVCTNGQISTHAHSGNYNRRTQGQDQGEMLDWAREAIDDIFIGLEHEFDAIEDLVKVKLGDDVALALADVFEQYRIPPTMRDRILLSLVESGDDTMYAIMQAITEAANADDVSDTVRTTLMEIGGDLPAAAGGRCSSCKRLAVSH